jgi:hypothetical protein
MISTSVRNPFAEPSSELAQPNASAVSRAAHAAEENAHVDPRQLARPR